MQEPARRRLVAIEPGAKQPEAQPRFVLDAEIVARRAAVLAPPGAFDALGPFGCDHFVQRVPPAEAHRRAVGHEREDVLDRLGPGEQAQRPRAQVGLDAEAAPRLPAELGARTYGVAALAARFARQRGAGRRAQFRRVSGARTYGVAALAARFARQRGARQGLRHVLRRERSSGKLGTMAVMGDEPRNPPSSEARAQAIYEAIELGLIFVSAEADLLVRTGLGGQYGEPRQIEAKARIDLVAERGQPLDEERADRLRIADGPRGAGGDAFDRAVGAEERELQASCAIATPDQCRLEPCREPLDGRQHVFLAYDRLVKTPLGDIGCNRQARSERLVFTAERAVDLAQEIGAETGGERRPRQIENVADALEAKARQRRDHLAGQPQRRKGQRHKTLALAASEGRMALD